MEQSILSVIPNRIEDLIVNCKAWGTVIVKKKKNEIFFRIAVVLAAAGATMENYRGLVDLQGKHLCTVQAGLKLEVSEAGFRHSQPWEFTSLSVYSNCLCHKDIEQTTMIVTC